MKSIHHTIKRERQDNSHIKDLKITQISLKKRFKSIQCQSLKKRIPKKVQKVQKVQRQKINYVLKMKTFLLRP